ncbi:hypothetical protein BDV96DRAFT_581381 [Lophiotrema nucula]|uniref:Uncharacterized protein n=1 Tax=Lophiotrema nucula TaxID=690887 RepID=A0A6A5Z055_9PLEO|nr:hypothetical protein BDV96DRAFT_581381 [Lophiotrema nucula]
MSSPNPNQRSPYLGFGAQPNQRPSSYYPDNRHSQGYPQGYQHQVQNAIPPGSYAQPHYADAGPIAELPAPMPTAPKTTTPAEQLDEDEKLARQISQMEIEEARSRSNSALTQPPRIKGDTTSGAQYSNQTYQRPHSYSLSTTASLGQEPFLRARPSQTHLSPQISVSSLPEVVPAPVYGTPSPQQLPTAHLPVPPADPVALAAYLEHHRQLPYPPQWVLPPVIAEFYGSFQHHPKSDWLEPLQGYQWHTHRTSDSLHYSSSPAFSTAFKMKGGTFRDPKFQWSMTSKPPSAGKQEKHLPTWTYELKRDSSTGMRKSEILTAPKGRELYPTYVHAINYDSLRFLGLDGKRYQWVSQSPISSLNGSRYDMIRHALFTGNEDPLYGQIVADHAFLDGFADAHGSLPDEALYIRSSSVDVGMIVATLQVLKEWELDFIRKEKRKYPEAFKISESLARQGTLGRMRYWRSADFEGRPPVSKVPILKNAADAPQVVGDALGTLGGDSGSGGDGGGGGGDGGGGGGGGGDGGGGGGGGF